MEDTLIFGPVPSRRLGKSIGINNIPPKHCSYSCLYCQLGKGPAMVRKRKEFYDPNLLIQKTREKIKKAESNGETIDYLTIVSDGEPTLDQNLGILLRGLAPLGFKMAVITNSSLLANPEVREDLAPAHWVSVKIDSLNEKIWRQMDRPCKGIEFHGIQEGLLAFARGYQGQLVTETMLIRGKNDAPQDLEQTAAFIKTLDPTLSYVGIPTRPPAVNFALPPGEESINRAFQIFCDHGLQTEYLIGYEGNQFAFTGDLESDILSITAVHPMREDAVQTYLDKAGKSLEDLAPLVREGKITISQYKGHKFYTRTLAPLEKPSPS